jgi:hypothetical protein
LNRISITIIGIPATHWQPKVKVGETVCLVKEPDNEYDDEAIMVKNKKGEQVGYVANSTKTVTKGTYSAGRLYDKMEDCTKAVIRYMTGDNGAIAEVREC